MTSIAFKKIIDVNRGVPSQRLAKHDQNPTLEASTSCFNHRIHQRFRLILLSS
jgi:hypothetical protein